MSDPRGRLFDRAAAAGVVVAALAVRLTYVAQLARTPLFSELVLDPAYYHEWARRIAAGDWLSGTEAFEQSPLYAYILALIYRFAGAGLLAPRIVQALVGAGTCLLVFLIARRVFGRPAALAAGLLAAVYAPSIFYDGMIMKTTYAIFLTAAMGAALVHSEGSRRGLIFWAGVLLGLASLVRDNLILLSPILALWLALDVWIRGGLDARRIREAAARVLLFAAGVALAVLPVLVRNVAVSGEWVLLTAGGGEVFYIGNNPGADGKYSPPPFVRAASGVEHEDFRREAARRLGHRLTRREASDFWLREGLRWIAGHPLDYAALLGRKILIFLNAYELPDNQNFYHHRLMVPLLGLPLPTWAALLPLAAAGIVLTLAAWREILPLYAIAGGYIATVMLFFNFARFRMPLVPILLAFAGEALVTLPGALRRSLSRSRLSMALGAAAAALLVALLALPLDSLHRGQSEAQLADLMLRSGRLEEAIAGSRRAIDLLESVYVEAGGAPGPGGHGVAEAGAPARPGIGASYYAILMEAYQSRARIERARGNVAEALVWIERAAAAAPDPVMGFDALVSCGEALLEAGRPAEAGRFLERARPADPRNVRLALLYAQSLHRTGHPQKAADVVEAMLQGTPGIGALDLADANYGLGLIYRDLGDVPRMKFHLREALLKNPDHPRAEWIRKMLAGAEPAPAR